MGDWIPNDRFPPPPHGWTCFHCGVTLHSVADAAAHFGTASGSTPACITKGERGLLVKLREIEQERDELSTQLAAARLGLNREQQNETIDRQRAGRGLDRAPKPSNVIELPRIVEEPY